jgi:hypothetical protein
MSSRSCIQESSRMLTFSSSGLFNGGNVLPRCRSEGLLCVVIEIHRVFLLDRVVHRHRLTNCGRVNEFRMTGVPLSVQLFLRLGSAGLSAGFAHKLEHL